MGISSVSAGSSVISLVNIQYQASLTMMKETFDLVEDTMATLLSGMGEAMDGLSRYIDMTV